MAKNINVSGALIPTTINTPLDARTVVETVDNLDTISYPYIGMQVYILSENRFIHVTSLGPKKIGPLIVPMSSIDGWEYNDAKVAELEGRVQNVEDILEDALPELEDIIERADAAISTIEEITENTIDENDINTLFPEDEEEG